MNVKIGTEAPQFLFWESISQNLYHYSHYQTMHESVQINGFLSLEQK